VRVQYSASTVKYSASTVEYSASTAQYRANTEQFSASTAHYNTSTEQYSICMVKSNGEQRKIIDFIFTTNSDSKHQQLEEFRDSTHILWLTVYCKNNT
jgi:hypothetical protein